MSPLNICILIFQMIRMNNERFAIPELLFRPSDVGIQEMGISESIMHCLTLVEKGLSLSKWKEAYNKDRLLSHEYLVLVYFFITVNDVKYKIIYE